MSRIARVGAATRGGEHERRHRRRRSRGAPRTRLTDLARRTGGHGVHRFGSQALPTDGPVAALDLFDRAPGDGAHVLALNADHRVGEPFGDLGLLFGREDVLNGRDVDEGHVLLLGWLSPKNYGPPDRRT